MNNIGHAIRKLIGKDKCAPEPADGVGGSEQVEDDLCVQRHIDTDTIKICGVVYSGHVFRSLNLAKAGTWLRIEMREGHRLSCHAPDSATCRMLDAITGRRVPNYLVSLLGSNRKQRSK